ncbi:hypothetical protein BGW38_002543 [Lunasporangiospora selenospora]|uniref:BRCC36 C-terminal helical domain-containing protein n=1 Tax=Lunasporangiospora selenospora TaxID=979761 RepID=A0A9P6G450_9FUNG|nr:hypothetical protein BGW38_002543 [Lunasporangiospora selenospora]
MSLPDRMTLVRNSGVYVQSLASLVDNLMGPTLQMLVDRDHYNKSLLESLRARKKELAKELRESRRRPSLENNSLVDLSDA